MRAKRLRPHRGLTLLPLSVMRPDSVGVFGVVFLASVGLSGTVAIKHTFSIPHNSYEQIRALWGHFHS